MATEKFKVDYQIRDFTYNLVFKEVHQLLWKLYLLLYLVLML